jgi:hypothetical protein
VWVGVSFREEREKKELPPLSIISHYFGLVSNRNFRNKVVTIKS